MTAPQFESDGQERAARTFGMWVFLLTEAMFFGGMLVAYASYRVAHPAAFERAGAHMDLAAGTVNTALLLVSSFCMARAVDAREGGRGASPFGWLVAAVALGAAFLAIKGHEYAAHLRDHLAPGIDFRFPGAPDGPFEMFFVLYFVITLVHAAHLALGVLAVGVLAVLERVRGPSEPTTLELAGLYWHFVDGIWVFLFPLLYQVGGR